MRLVREAWDTLSEDTRAETGKQGIRSKKISTRIYPGAWANRSNKQQRSMAIEWEEHT